MHTHNIKPNTQSGFTLVEVLVIAVIICVLFTIAIPKYNDYVMRTRIAEAVAMLNKCRKEVEIKYQTNGSFPTAACSATKAIRLTINMPAFEQFYHDNDGTKMWIAVVFQNSFIAGTNWDNRVIHLGGKYSSSKGRLVWYCGRWDPTWLATQYMKYLPPECNTDGVSAALNAIS